MKQILLTLLACTIFFQSCNILEQKESTNTDATMSSSSTLETSSPLASNPVSSGQIEQGLISDRDRTTIADTETTCSYNDFTYLPGEYYSNTSLCNTCICAHDGTFNCSEAGCTDDQSSEDEYYWDESSSSYEYYLDESSSEIYWGEEYSSYDMLLEEMQWCYNDPWCYEDVNDRIECADTTTICGTDGRTYGNACIALELFTIEAAYVGQCDETKECSAILDPVCGLDGVTYDNGCIARQDSQTDIFYPEACNEKQGCPWTWNPTCGSNGKLYDTPCHASIDSVDYTIGYCPGDSSTFYSITEITLHQNELNYHKPTAKDTVFIEHLNIWFNHNDQTFTLSGYIFDNRSKTEEESDSDNDNDRAIEPYFIESGIEKEYSSSEYLTLKALFDDPNFLLESTTGCSTIFDPDNCPTIGMTSFYVRTRNNSFKAYAFGSEIKAAIFSEDITLYLEGLIQITTKEVLN